MENIQFSPNPFPDKQGAKIAEDLVRYIADNEQELNFDECVFSLAEELRERRDSAVGYPEGLYFIAKFEKAVSKNFTGDKRFKHLLQDKESNDSILNITIQNFYTEFDGQAIAYAFCDMVEREIRFEHWHKAVNAIAKALTSVLAGRYRANRGNFFNLEIQGHVRKSMFSRRYAIVEQ